MDAASSNKPLASKAATLPWVSVIILNYNGREWMSRCLESLVAQTIFAHTQVVIADNASTDGSDGLSQQLIAKWENALFVQNGCNPGFGAGSNRAVKLATGKYLFFLNPDVWLEPDCLERLYTSAEENGGAVAGAVVLEYDDDTLQSRSGIGFDICGYAVTPPEDQIPEILFVGCGFYFIRKELFERIGGYDEAFFLYGEELDLSWRVWAAGERIFHVPTAKIHHRGAAAVNPKGGTKVVEIRTSESKRFYANRNHLLTLLKDAQHALLLLLVPALILQFAEGLAGMVLSRRWSFFSRTFLAVVADCWRLRAHVLAERRRIRSLRRRSDFWMLRFFTWRFNRWRDWRIMLRLGLPVVDKR